MTRREWNQRLARSPFGSRRSISILIVVVLIMVPDIYGGGDGNRRTVGLVGASSAQLAGAPRSLG